MIGHINITALICFLDGAHGNTHLSPTTGSVMETVTYSPEASEDGEAKPGGTSQAFIRARVLEPRQAEEGLQEEGQSSSANKGEPGKSTFGES